MGKRKNILVFNAGPIFPIGGMHQVRVYNQLMSLSKDHSVDCMFLYTRKDAKALTQKNLSPYCNKIIPLKTLSQTIYFRGFKKLFLNWFFRGIHYPLDYFSYSNIFTSKKIGRNISHFPYDIVISHYWQASGFLKYLSNKVFRCLDTHYLVEENLDLYQKGMYGHLDNDRLGRRLEKELSIQNDCFKNTDLLIVNSYEQQKILEQTGSHNLLCIPNGQNLKPYLEYQRNDEQTFKNLLFYGALSNQFNQKALRRIIEKLLPLVRKEHPEIKQIIMGASPPEWLKKIAVTDSTLEVTGFVGDVRPVFASCFAAVIPLESGSGFRGRTVELLASGVPVVGTTNALQSVRIEHGVNGFIADTDEEIIHWVVQLIQDKELRKRISDAGRTLASTNYTLEATFGILSKYLQKEVITK
jgi:glycosyltransferase involved in cell wall biosynthesis